MAAAAIAPRIQPARIKERAAAARAGLAFDQLGGPLVAVCGLAGGAGTSTLALAFARHAAAASTAPVLVSEADPNRAGLASIVGQASPHPLVELARRVAEDAAPPEAFLELEPGLRLVAAWPQHGGPAGAAAVIALLDEARAAHGLVVLDHGTGWTAASPIIAAATHILWTVPATGAGLVRATALFESDVMPRPGGASEVLVAIAHAARPNVRVRPLRRLAATRCERLILVPCSGDAARGASVVDEALARALGGLAPTLRGRR